jgi:hypothetical protein
VEALPDKLASTTAYAFTKAVLCRYGACAEVVTDQGAEFQEEFHQTLRAAFIDHRTTSANHPSANGQAERTVQSIKRALEKYAALEDGNSTTWDEYLPHVALGYRVSVQSALGCSPYEMMYGTKALLPSAIQEQFAQPLELNDPEQVAEYLLQRATALRRQCAIAASNLRIAQHRDQQRYLRMRSGFYNTVTTKFSPLDYVYVRRPSLSLNLQSSVKTGIYRIREVRDSGTLVVHGMCGTLAEVHTTNCAPCHLPNIDPTIDLSLRAIPTGHSCHTCGSPEREATMLICDGCLRGYHLTCLEPPLETVPAESPWCCPDCIQQGYTPAIVEELLREDLREQGLDRPVLRDQRQVMEEKAAAMDGQPVLLKTTQDGHAPTNITAKIRYLPVGQRRYPRRPLLLEVPGYQAEPLSVGKAQRATRTPLEVHLTKVLDPAMAQFVTMAFVAARDPPVRPDPYAAFRDSYPLLSAEGFRGLYHDAFGSLQGCPSTGLPTDWIPGLAQVLDNKRPMDVTGAPGAADLLMLFESVDIQGCLRVADPVDQAPDLRAVLQQRYQRKLLVNPSSPPHPANWLFPGHYRALAAKGPVDWIFLYPPPNLTDLALAIAVSRARVGVALWVSRAFLSNLTTPRLGLLTVFKAQRRLAMVQSWDGTHLWVCVFASSTHRTRMLCPSSAAVTAWTSV